MLLTDFNALIENSNKAIIFCRGWGGEEGGDFLVYLVFPEKCFRISPTDLALESIQLIFHTSQESIYAFDKLPKQT